MSFREQLINASREKISALEGKLSGVLRPIPPRREFVRGLEQKIQAVRQPAIVRSLSNVQFFLLLLAGLVSAALLVVIGLRALLSLFGGRGGVNRI